MARGSVWLMAADLAFSVGFRPRPDSTPYLRIWRLVGSKVM